MSNNHPNLVAAVLGLIFWASAMGGTPGGAAQSPSAEAPVRAAIDEMWKALGAQDQPQFERLTGPGWVLVTARGARVDAAGLLTMHRQRIKDFRLDASNVTIRVQGDIAWAVYDAEMLALAQGEPWGGRFVVTSVFERRGGSWICVHTHETRVPTD